MKVDNQHLYEYLIESHEQAAPQIEQLFLRAQKENIQLAKLLIQENVLSENVVIESMAKLLGFPFVDLTKSEILEATRDIIPEQIARKSHVVAFEKKGDKLSIAMLNPDDLQTLDFLHKKTGLDLIVYVASPESIRAVLKQYEKTLKAEFSDIIVADDAEETDLAKIAEDLPIVRIVDTLIKHAILQGASDIHIEPLEKEIIVRYRVDGMLRAAMTLPKNMLPGMVARIKVLTNLKLDEHRLPQDGRFKIETDEYKVAFRVSILPVFDGEKIVMRLLDESGNGLTLEKMGLHGEGLEIVHREVSKPNGMILVTGPTGSGKTTTLYTIVDILNSTTVNISTIEDPVEYRMDRINQTQVHAKIGMTFEAGLRSLLRQDPDIIMVGEIRDQETLEIAIHAAMTGHLLLSTLHTNSAAGAIPRMVDMGAQQFLIASTTNVVIGQRLVRKLCSECAEKYLLLPKEVDTLGKSYDLESIHKVLVDLKIFEATTTWTDVPFYRAKGCSQCGDSGYKGRNGIFEVFEITEEIEKLITQNATTDELQNEARKGGMLTMIDDGFFKAVRGITTLEEVMRVTKE